MLPFFNGSIKYGNVTVNVTDGSPSLHVNSNESQHWKAVVASLYAIIFVIGVTGNSLVVYTFGWRRRRKKMANEFLLMCLGVCDLLTSIVFPVLYIVYIFTHHSTTSYIISCLIHPPLIVTSISLSQIILVLICYDRYRAITKPLGRKLYITFAKYGTIIGCMVSLVISIPMFLHLHIGDAQTYVCFRVGESSPMMIAQATVVLVRDLSALFVMAWLIKKMLRSLACSEWFRKNTNSTVVSDFKRTRKLLFAVVSLFTICIFPTDIYWAYFAINYRNSTADDIDWDAIALEMTSLVLIQVANSIVNVFVYSAVHREFQKVLREILSSIRNRGSALVCRRTASARPVSKTFSTEMITKIATTPSTSPMVSRHDIQKLGKVKSIENYAYSETT